MSYRIILRLKRGRGFGFMESAILIKATLSQIVHETELCEPSEEPVLDVELHWESDKKTIKRLRTLRSQIKVEFISKPRTRIGYFLIPLTAAWLIKHGQHTEVEDKWCKLIDAGFCKPSKPEFLINLRIEEQERKQTTVEKTKTNCSVNVVSEDTSLQESSSETSFNSEITYGNTQSCVPELCEEEGVIQLGPREETSDFFLLTVLLGDCGNLSSIVADEEEHNSVDMYFCFNVLGVTVQTNRVRNISQSIFSVKEKNVFRIRSSVKFLQQYLSTVPVIKLILMSGEKEIAYANMDISVIIPVDNAMDSNKNSLGCSLMSNKRCSLLDANTKEMPDSKKLPFIDIKVKLKFMGKYEDIILPKAVNEEMTGTHFSTTGSSMKDNEIKDNLSDFCNTDISIGNSTSPVPSAIGVLNMAKRPENTYWTTVTEHCSDVYHEYCLHIELQELIFHKFPLQNNFFFIFNHSKAQILTTALDEICVNDVNKTKHLQGFGCKMHFQTPVLEIYKELSEEPPTVSIFNKVNGENIKFAEAQLDLGLLFLNKEKVRTVTALLSSLDSGEIVGILTVLVTLKDYGLQLPKDVKNSPVAIDRGTNPLLFNNVFNMRAVKELEEWKEKQKDIFKEELQKKENYYLHALLANWDYKKEELQYALNKNIQKFSALAQSLEVSVNELREKCTEVAEQEIQIQDWKEMYRRTHIELEHERTKYEHIRKELEKELHILKQENKDLEEELKKLKSTMLIINPSGDTSNIVTVFKEMESKCEDALRAKKFFKNELANLLHEHRAEVQAQMKHKMEELRALGLDQLLNQEKKEQQKDHEDTVSNAGHSVTVKSTHSFDGCHEDVQRDATRLIDEMDALLCKGNYSKDFTI